MGYVYQALDELHTISPDDLTLDELQAFFFHKFPDSNKDVYLVLFKTLSESVIGEATGVAMLKQIKERREALSLSEAAFKFSTGNAEISAIQTAYDKLSAAEEEKDEFEFVTLDLDTLLENTVFKPGLRWRLDFLNKSLGSLRKGDFGFLFARPETGKTTFLASEISAMLDNLPDEAGPIIWVNNEESGDKVMVRMIQAHFGATLSQIMSNKKKYRDEFLKRFDGKFLFIDDANFSKAQVERLLKAKQPSLIVFDQITKIKGFAADREDLKLGAICVWAREMAKSYCAVIGVMQADGTAEGQKWLMMDHVANAKTAVQAEADWIVGIGKTHAEGAEFLRYVNISKNKLHGDSDSIANLRHGRIEILIKPEIARYADIMKYD